jgi:hypothetical protein
MAEPVDFKKFYVAKLRALRKFVLPDPSDLKDAGALLARGAAWALVIALISAASSVALAELTGLILPFDSAVRFGLAIAIGASGGILDFSGFEADFAQIGNFAVGVHSGTIALAIFLVARRFGRKAGRALGKHSTSQVTGKFAIYLGLGFALFNFFCMLLAQGSIHFASAVVKISPISIVGTSVGGVLIGLSAYVGFRSEKKKSLTNGASTFDFAVASIWNFFAIYGAFLILATMVFVIQFFIQPNFSESYQIAPAEPATNYPASQVTWIVAAFIAFLPNVLMQVFLFFSGFANDSFYSIGLDQYLGGLDQGNSLLQTAGWPIYLAVMALVLLTALMSGAVASASTGYSPKAPGRLVPLIGSVAMLATFVSYLAGVQGRISLDESKKTEIGLWVGASVLSGLVFATLLGSIGYWAATRGRSFARSAFNSVVKLRRVNQIEAPGSTLGRVFGIFVTALLVACTLAPIGAATINRVWASTQDGPAQVADHSIKDLETMSLKELKSYFNTTSSSLPWLSDAILESARPNSANPSNVILTNAKGKPWQVGNLDANILIKFASPSGLASAQWRIETSSELTNPSWLINHPIYTAKILGPTVVIRQASFLKRLKNFQIVVNGEKVNPGDYQLIPGFYRVQAPGYKLVSPTDLTYSTSGLKSSFVIGTKVELPAGGSDELNQAITKSAESCSKLSADGSSACFTSEDVISSSKIQVGTSMPEAFDFSWTNFKASNTTCTRANRRDYLVSATIMKSIGQCSIDVSYTENYFGFKEIQVPHYTSHDVCVAGYTDDYGNLATYAFSLFGQPIYSVNGTYYYTYDLTYDSCASRRTENVQEGWDSKTVRGNLIGKSVWGAKVSFTRAVVGTLAEDNTFTVK